jgi:PAS domain S-box-containing protein/putative nucleotidyltransferase with HDIG domain
MKITNILFAILAPLIVGLFQHLIWSIVDPYIWFLFFPTVYLISRYLGFWEGVIATFVSVAIVWGFFITPQFSLDWHVAKSLYPTFAFLFVSYFFCDVQKKLRLKQVSLKDDFNVLQGQQNETLRLLQENLDLDEIKFSQLANSLPQVVWVTTPSGENIFFNNEWYSYTGLSVEESMGAGWNKPFHPDDQQRAWYAWNTAVSKKSEYSLECRIRRADGAYRWWLIRGMPTLNKKNKIEKWFGTCTDIHDIKVNAENLASEKQKLQTVFENSPDGSAIIANDGTLILGNNKYLAFFGLEGSDLTQCKYNELMDKFVIRNLRGELMVDSSDPLARALKGELVTAQEIHFENKLSGQEWYGSYSAMPIRGEHDEIAGAVVSVRDVTVNIMDKVHLITMVKEQEAVLSSGIVGIAKSKGNQFSWLNGRFSQNFGYETNELLGHSSDILLPNIAVLDLKQNPLNSFDLPISTLSKEAVQLKKKDGSLGWYLVSGGLLALGSDEAIWMSIDITQDVENKDLLLSYTKRLEVSMQETLQGFSKAIEMRDPYTAGHQQRVGNIAADIARKLKLSEEQIKNMTLIGMVHDVGKIGIPAEILSKPSKLTSLEYEMVKSHVNVGYEILKDIHFDIPVAKVVHEHHERLDGSGYPQGLKGEEISFEAKIIAVADVVEAMASHRPYRPALGIEEALREIESGRGIKYDPSVVDACLELFQKDGYQIGGVSI